MGIIGGGVLMVLFAVTAIKVDSLAKKMEALSSIETDNRNAAALAEKIGKDVMSLTRSVQAAFDSIGPEIGKMKASIAKLEVAVEAGTGVDRANFGKVVVVAGHPEYVVGPEDTGKKISDVTGASLEQLEAANPGVDWRHLTAGQRIKILPKPPGPEVPDQQPAPSSGE